ncbi:hypothetical protein KJ942_00505 [bacterium]|nr:hypothetical protein [bacterium]MBU4024009.1 hypothetical protein [bacterium]MBU4058476.1 hypothetical protein [bacterium]MBU4110697.1 hypothetical protein [bacterium]
MKTTIKNVLREKERKQVAKALLFMIVPFSIIGCSGGGDNSGETDTNNSSIENPANNTSATNASVKNTTFEKSLTWKGVNYGAVVSPVTQRVWLDRNLGASQVCTAHDDTACYGDYYQWGRETDGHEKSTSATTKTQATDIINAGSEYVTWIDWTTADSDGALRAANWSKTDGTSICPVGYRVPTIDELYAENAAFEGDAEIYYNLKAFNSFLKFPSAGIRYSGDLSEQGRGGVVWSSTRSGNSNSYYYYFFAGNASTNEKGFTQANSVRCIKD